jgi:hypothetical protein
VQRKEQRFGDAMQAEDMQQLGRKVLNRLPQDLMIMQFQRLELEEASHGGMAIDTIKEQTAVNLLVALFGAQSVAGGEDGNRVAAQPQRFDHSLSMMFESSGVVWRIQIRYGQNFHSLGPSIEDSAHLARRYRKDCEEQGRAEPHWLPCSFARFASGGGANGDDVKRIDDIEVAVWMFHHHIMPANKNKFRVGCVVLPAVRITDDGLPARGQVLPDQVAIHVDLLAWKPQSVKAVIKHYESHSRSPIRRPGSPVVEKCSRSRT